MFQNYTLYSILLEIQIINCAISRWQVYKKLKSAKLTACFMLTCDFCHPTNEKPTETKVVNKKLCNLCTVRVSAVFKRRLFTNSRVVCVYRTLYNDLLQMLTSSYSTITNARISLLSNICCNLLRRFEEKSLTCVHKFALACRTGP